MFDTDEELLLLTRRSGHKWSIGQHVEKRTQEEVEEAAKAVFKYSGRTTTRRSPALRPPPGRGCPAKTTEPSVKLPSP